MRAAAAEAGLRIDVESAGTGGWHEGDPPDPRAAAEAARRGVDISRQQARAVRAEEFTRFDHIFTMDSRNLRDMQARAPAGATAELAPLRPDGAEIPDPYYGGADGFAETWEMIAEAVAARLQTLR